MQNQINRLLEEVAFKVGTLREARNRFSDRLAPEFRIFDYLRTDEMGLSRCIASLLDPKGKHGQGSVFLDAFLECIVPTAIWARNESCEVTMEKQVNGLRRIDIFLEFKRGIIGIENKPWAADQDQQLTDYAAYVKKTAVKKNWLLLFLSNREPSDCSIDSNERKKLEKDGQYVRRDYGEIIEWLEGCAFKSKALVVRIFIEELTKFIRMNINGELDMSEKKEIQQILLSSTKNIESAFHVIQGVDGIKKELLKKFRDDLEIELNIHGFKLVWDEEMEKKWKSCTGFGVTFQAGQDKYLRFEFQYSGLNGLVWGIRKENEFIKDDPVIWNRIRDVFEKRFGQGKSSIWWAWYSRAPDGVLNADMENWGTSASPWVLIRDGGEAGLVKRISELAKEVKEAFAGDINLLTQGNSECDSR